MALMMASNTLPLSWSCQRCPPVSRAPVVWNSALANASRSEGGGTGPRSSKCGEVTAQPAATIATTTCNARKRRVTVPKEHKHPTRLTYGASPLGHGLCNHYANLSDTLKPTMKTMSRLCSPERQCLVLLVEDSSESYELYSEVLASAGYAVVGADNGDHAYELAGSPSPDLIIMDYELHGV